MFRRLANTLPPDANYPHDLKQLGLFINSATQIKYISHPEDSFRYTITTSERHNDVHSEAVKACLRAEIVSRLQDLGVERLWVPTLTTEKSKGPSLPIFATKLESLKEAKRVVVVFGKMQEDMGVWSWRACRGEEGLERGSVLGFMRDLYSRFESGGAGGGNETAIVVANPGQLIYSYKHDRAMTMSSWLALPRPSALHGPAKIDEKMNFVAGSESPEAHMRWVMKNVLDNEELVNKETELYLVGVEDGATELVRMLAESWSEYSSKLNIAAVALVSLMPFQVQTAPVTLDNDDFLSFLARRSQAWSLTPFPLGAPFANPTTTERLKDLMQAEKDPGKNERAMREYIYLSPTVSGEVVGVPEDVMPNVSGAVLDWFEKVAAADARALAGDGDRYSNEELVVSREAMEEAQAPLLAWRAEAETWSSDDIVSD